VQLQGVIIRNKEDCSRSTRVAFKYNDRRPITVRSLT